MAVTAGTGGRDERGAIRAGAHFWAWAVVPAVAVVALEVAGVALGRGPLDNLGSGWPVGIGMLLTPLLLGAVVGLANGRRGPATLVPVAAVMVGLVIALQSLAAAVDTVVDSCQVPNLPRPTTDACVDHGFALGLTPYVLGALVMIGLDLAARWAGRGGRAAPASWLPLALAVVAPFGVVLVPILLDRALEPVFGHAAVVRIGGDVLDLVWVFPGLLALGLGVAWNRSADAGPAAGWRPPGWLLVPAVALVIVPVALLAVVPTIPEVFPPIYRPTAIGTEMWL